MDGLDPLPENLTLPDLSAAKREATRLMGNAVFALIDDFWDAGECVVRVCDENGLCLFEVHAFAVASPATMKH